MRVQRAFDPASDRPPSKEPLVALCVVSVVLLGLRLFASQRIGFGDSEALYAAYAAHPQPAYLDHPGLVGVVARAIGGGAIPTPARTHVVTALWATVLPWLMALTCRVCGATRRHALAAGIVTAVVPEMAIGLFALTPDLLLATAWMGAIALAATALCAPADSVRAFIAFLGAGLATGFAASSKVTGVLLGAALLTAYLTRPARRHLRTLGPWAGLAAGAIVFAPVVIFEAQSGYPMLRHRLIDTQLSAGASLRNACALVFGQFLYVSPVVLYLAAVAVRTAWRARADAVGSLLLAATLVPACGLVPLCIWSRVAEPHWIAPAFLALVPAAARAQVTAPRRIVVAAAAIAGAMVALVHAWVLVPAAVRLVADASYDPQLDIANELYGWPQALRAVRAEIDAARPDGASRSDVVVVAPHWVLCAQLEAALHDEVAVGCDGPAKDDFDGWLPRRLWRNVDTVIWVSDARFGPLRPRPTYDVTRTNEVRIERAGRVVRVFTISVATRSAVL